MKLDLNSASQLVTVRNHIYNLVNGTRANITKDQLSQCQGFLRQADAVLIDFACSSDLTKEAVAIKAAMTAKMKIDPNPPQIGGVSPMARRIDEIAKVSKQEMAKVVPQVEPEQKPAAKQTSGKKVVAKVEPKTEQPKAKKDKKQMIEELLAQEAKVNVNI